MYDALLLAVGARERKPSPDVSLFTDRTSGQTYRRIVDGLDAGVINSLVLIGPDGLSWPLPLPLYELALLTARQAHDRGLRPEIAVVTLQSRPLHAFGDDVGKAVEGLLSGAGITLHTRTRAHVDGPRRLRLEPGDIDLHPDRIVTLPTITGPNLRGIPGEAIDRFISVDDRCRVCNTDGRVFAAGDVTDLPMKNASLAAQQADTAATGIAHLAGAGPAPPALRPVLYGTLLTGEKPLYLAAHLIAGTGSRTQIHDQPPWRPDQLVFAEELTAYIAGLRPQVSRRPAALARDGLHPAGRIQSPQSARCARHGEHRDPGYWLDVPAVAADSAAFDVECLYSLSEISEELRRTHRPDRGCVVRSVDRAWLLRRDSAEMTSAACRELAARPVE